ncbi:type VII secretion integral membrane protein EccD [Actinopolyspora lacussalsi subsp. righensis]|uniref:Type VII secretion integral membrane protein EccD n=1 Tax=Actinopolyspora righensis TaxID=995060 RepID=A0A1I6XAQ6_9ACTN|nr:type VII secretion integral membrane protein EccD [Actinopolyspora righensis]SFT35327.1 type VII secretion integral membrane protein EccD [Actinopolyspora righensis]
MDDATKDVTNQLCRLRLIVKDRSVEMALPTDVALIDLLPAILRHAGGELADEGVEHEGWVLQRFGRPPFDEERTTAELGLLDGETVHLRPRADSLPPIDFDDLVDGIAEQARRRSDPWSQRLSRWMLLAFGGTALLVGLVVLGSGGPRITGTITAGGTALVLLLTATALARGRADTITAVVLAGLALPYAGLCGWYLPLLSSPEAQAPASIACAAMLVVAGLAIGLVGTAEAALLFVSGLFTVVPLGITAVIDAASPLDSGQAAGIGLMLVLLALGFVPTSSFRLAGLSLPPLPTSSEEFGQDTDPFPHEVVVERSAAADRYMTGLYAALGLTAVVLFTALLVPGGMWSMITTAVAALLLLLRSRHVDSARQRWPLLITAGYALALDGVVLALGLDPFARLWYGFTAALVLALLLVVASRALPGRKLAPYWGRAVDLLETFSALALVPLLLAALDVYMFVRGLAG